MKKFSVIFFLVSFVAFSSEDMTISFINYKFDPLTSTPTLVSTLQTTETEGENFYILQFTGPIYSEWKEKISEAGGVFHFYVPYFAYVVQMTPEEKNEVEKFSFVRWIGLFHPAYKIHPGVYEKRDTEKENKLPVATGVLKDNKIEILREEECPCGKDALWVENDPLLHLSIRLFANASIDYVARELESWGSVVQQTQKDCNLIIIRIPPDSLNALAKRKEVESIEPYLKRVLSSSTWRYAVQEPSDSFTIASDTDLGQPWDTVTSGITLADKGITGKGEIVTIYDTGLDHWSGFFQDPEDDAPGSNHIVVEAYTNEGGDIIEISTSTAPYGCRHGTNVASIIAGNPSIADNHPRGTNLMPIYDWGGQTRGNTPDSFPVRLYIQDFGFTRNDSCILGTINMTTVMNKAYNTYNSRIHQNSWNYDSYLGDYVGVAPEIDNMVWNNKDFVVVFSAGNFGSSGNNTVAAPATSKNCICVGASWNPTFDVSPDSVASFSSRGWTTDTRIKPEVVAPGGNDLPSSTYRRFLWGGGVNTTWAGDSAHTRLVGMVGTSQAAPQVSSVSAMIREYFKDGFYPEGDTSKGTPFNPSAALVKAVVIASTIDMGTGGGQGNPVPNQAEGWGRVVLDNALFFSGDSTRVLFVSDDATGVSTGDSVVNTVNVVNSSEPLKFVLAWSDTAASVLANPTLVNNLDLIVTAPNSNRYKGNVFSGGFSQTGGSTDNRNNVEVVWLPNPAQMGTYSITVKGFNCPNGSIPFAVAAVGGFEVRSGIADPDKDKPREYKYLNFITPFAEKIDIQLNIIKTSNVDLSLYDIAGREITKLIDEKLTKGTYSIKCGENLAAGVYFAVLKIDGEKAEERKIVKIAK
jgi:hypothetical protein